MKNSKDKSQKKKVFVKVKKKADSQAEPVEIEIEDSEETTDPDETKEIETENRDPGEGEDLYSSLGIKIKKADTVEIPHAHEITEAEKTASEPLSEADSPADECQKAEEAGLDTVDIDEEEFLSPDDLIASAMSAARKPSPDREEKPEEKQDFPVPAGVVILDIEKTGKPDITEERLSPDEIAGIVAEKEPELEEAPEKLQVLSPSAMEEGDEKQYNQLDLGPILKKSDIDSPVEMISPDELEEEDEEFVSLALPVDAMVAMRFRIVKIIKEHKDRNTYIVHDTTVTDRKMILKEFIPPKMEKEDLRNRRNKFQDTLRIISDFKHPNLVNVYEPFTENYREYYVMDRVDGLTMEKLAEMNTKPFSEAEVLKWGLTLCDTIEFMHHRPKPFTLTSLDSNQLMIDHQGTLIITNYDMQRFFNPKRTLEYMPDDPTQLYWDITLVGRLLYFLLTKQEYSDLNDADWPDNVSKKMRKLLMTACMDGQKSIGDIRDFKAKLEDTQVEDKEIVVKKSWGFPLHKINFTPIFRAIDAVIHQRPYMIAVEIIAIVFLLAFYFVNTKASTKQYVRPPDVPLVYVGGFNFLNTVNLNNREILYEGMQRFSPTSMLPATIRTGTKKDPDKIVEKQVLVLCVKPGSSLRVLDLQTNDIIKTIDVDYNSFLIKDRMEKFIWVFHRSSSIALILDGNTLEKNRLVKIPGNVVYTASLPYTVKEDGGEAPVKEDNSGENGNYEAGYILEGMVVSLEKSTELISFHPETGQQTGTLDLGFQPGPIVPVIDQGLILVVNPQNSSLIPVNISNGSIQPEIEFPEPFEGGVYGLYIKEKQQVWFCLGESDQIAVYNLESGEFEDKTFFAGGSMPVQMDYYPEQNQVWILNKESKNMVIRNPDSLETVGSISLVRVPQTFFIIK